MDDSFEMASAQTDQSPSHAPEWERVVGVAESTHLKIREAFSDLLGMELVEPHLLGVTLQSAAAPESTIAREIQPLSVFPATRPQLAALYDAYRTGKLDQHPVFRTAYERLISEHDRFAREGSVIVTDEDASILLGPKAILYEKNDVLTPGDEIAATTAELKRLYGISHFVYTPGPQVDPWTSVILFGLRSTTRLRISFAPLSDCCQTIHEALALSRDTERGLISTPLAFRDDLVAFMRKHELKNASLAKVLKLHEASFANKKTGAGGRSFTKDEQTAIVAHIQSAYPEVALDSYPALAALLKDL